MGEGETIRPSDSCNSSTRKSTGWIEIMKNWGKKIYRMIDSIIPSKINQSINQSTLNISLRKINLHSLDRDDLFVPRASTTMAQTLAYATIGPALYVSTPRNFANMV